MKKSEITILGLGPGDAKLLTREVWEILTNIPEVYLRTREHPVVNQLPDTLSIKSFDPLYESLESFDEVYGAIADEIVSLGTQFGDVYYGVPGDPNIAEASTELIRLEAEKRGLTVTVLPGLSFLEPAFRALQLDPLPRLALVDALAIAAAHHPSFPPDYPALIPQIYSRSLATDVKLTLMGNYPDDHRVALIHRAGTPAERVEHLALYKIDRSREIGSLTCLFIPSLESGTSMESFQDLIAHLRSPEGCPWDREQTHLTLRPYLLEETYETLAALDAQNSSALEEELGDLLIQIVLHAQIASETGDFNLAGIIKKVSEKLIYRHPHVFGNLTLENSDEVKKNWELLKSEERKQGTHGAGGSLAGVPEALPALSVADSYQKRAARVGFDWPGEEGVIEKIREEFNEVLEARGQDGLPSEIGDLLFAVVNLARWNDLDAESLLRETNLKFRFRFEKIEQEAATSGRSIQDLTLQEMDDIWENAKSFSQD